MMVSRTLGICFLAFLSCSLGHPSAAQGLLSSGYCRSKVIYAFGDQISALRRASSTCHDEIWGTPRSRGEPLVLVNPGIEQCRWHGYQACAGPISGCPELIAARERAFTQCDRQAADAEREKAQAADDARRRQQHASPSMPGSLASPSGVRGVLARSSEQIGERWWKSVSGYRRGADSPFSYMKDFHQLKVGDYLRKARRAQRAWETVAIGRSLSKAVSGGSTNERFQAAFSIFDRLRSKAISATGNPAAGVFATYSFIILRNFQTALINDLNDVASNVALFKISQDMARAREDVAYSIAQRQWAQHLAAGAARREVDASTTDLVGDFQAKARQIAYANAQRQLKAQEAERQAREDAERQAREQAERQARDQARRQAAVEAQWQAALEAEEAARRARSRQENMQMLNAIMGGITSGIVRSQPSYTPPPPRSYAPPPSSPPPSRPSYGGGNDCSYRGPGSACR